MTYQSDQLSNSAVIPEIASNVFADHQDSRFAVGLVAIGDKVIPGREEELLGYLRLRAKVYAEQNSIISKDLILADGTERDKDDFRSAHFCVIENAANNPRVIGAMRLIVKSHENPELLPIEEFFPEVFEANPAQELSTEVSRYICRHEIQKVQNGLKWLLYAAGLSYVINNKLGPTYALIEQPLERGLKASGVPVSRIGDPKYIEEYNSENFPVSIDTEALARRMNVQNPGMIASAKAAVEDFVYSGAVQHIDSKIEVA